MSALIVDTSVWVAYFRGESRPELERALAAGLVVLSPIVAAELLSVPLSKRRRDGLADLLADLPLHPAPFEHWANVGLLRARMARAGLTVSTPDAHVARCTLEIGGARLWSHDHVFARIAAVSDLRLYVP